MAAVLVAVGICLRLNLGVVGVSPGAARVCLAAALAIAATALLPFPYLWRASVGAIIGTIVVVVGLCGGGPLALLASPDVSSVWLEMSRILACVVLPAALLFRSHYRAYARGRMLLAVAYALALPFLIGELSVSLEAASVLARIGAGLSLCAVLSGSFAFMEAPTTSTTAWCAEVLTGVVALELGLREAYAAHPAGAGPFAYSLTALAFVASVSPIALGLFQVLAAVHGPEARLVNVHQAPPAENAEASVSD